MAVLVFADAADGKIVKSSFEAICYGSKIAASKGDSTTVVTYGSVDDAALAALGNYGANKVLVARNINAVDSQQLTKLVAQAAQDENADVIVFSQDPTGKAVAPRVSIRLNAGHVPGAVDLPNMDGGFTVKKNVFSGKAFANYSINTEKKVISLMPNSYQVETTDATATVAEINAEVGAPGVTVKEIKKSGTAIALPEAELVVSAGRGLKGPENWGMVEELAGELGAATACSRPVADIGWRPHHEHVGQTGVAIAPNLYIAIGISGAIQHLAGVNRSKTIVVVNIDPEAPFFKAADYGIVGDAFEVVPKLVEAAKQFKASNN
jgi:electron transfer flavoprotein alpha subunit